MRSRFLLQMFLLVGVAMTVTPALADGGPPPTATPEPASIIVFAGLAALGFVGWLWKGRNRRR